MPKTTQFTLNLPSRPGVLAKVSRALASAGVNITALCAEERGKIRVVASNAARAKRALKTGKYRVREEPAFVVRLQNKPGALARLAEKLARARVNIRSAYATTAGRGPATVVLTVGSPARARRILGR